SHILGYVGPISKEEYDAARAAGSDPYLPDDNVGRGGLEQALEPELRGRHGGRWVLKDARGVELAELVDRRRDPEPGYTAVLTIDMDFQKAVTKALQEGIKAADAGARKDGKEPVGAGVVVALDPQTGEVLALVSLPTFDNQAFVDGISQEQYDALLNDPYKPLTNFAISGAFPPGSTIKPLLACVGLQEGTLRPDTHYRCLGSIRVPAAGNELGGNVYVCWNHAGHGTIAVEDGIAQSCDVFFYNVAAPGQEIEGTNTRLHYYIPGDPSPHPFEGVGIDKIERYLKRDFGFGAPTGIELAAEAKGLVPNAKWLYQTLHENWSVGDTINVSIGQGYLSCTPLQMASAVAAIANGGTYYRPRLVRALKDASGRTVREFAPEPVRRLSVAPERLEIVRRGMLRTVTDGTAKGKFVKTGSGVSIAGKTGTAEFGEAVNGKYKKQHAWFTAFAPFDRPRIALAVLIEGGGEGATYAVPVADAVLAAFFGRRVA
ncbi:MAG: penicillin-binding protein 2, partial [Thermomicrobiaceae bacterium]|nr:penicillin-binding protein 2 [Thermomicrobiaceae bacterium]